MEVDESPVEVTKEVPAKKQRKKRGRAGKEAEQADEAEQAEEEEEEGEARYAVEDPVRRFAPCDRGCR